MCLLIMNKQRWVEMYQTCVLAAKGTESFRGFMRKYQQALFPDVLVSEEEEKRRLKKTMDQIFKMGPIRIDRSKL